jgi:PAP2 superfamily
MNRLCNVSILFALITTFALPTLGLSRINSFAAKHEYLAESSNTEIGIKLPSLSYLLVQQQLLNANGEGDTSSQDSGLLSRVGHDVIHVGKTLGLDWWHVYTSPARMTWKDGAFAAGAIAIGFGIYAADQEIYDEMQLIKDDDWFRPISEVGNFFEPMGTRAFTESWLIGGMFVGYITGYAPLRDISADALESIYLSLVVMTGTKFGMARLRPYQGERTDWFKPKGAAFISGHTTNVFQLAGVVAHHFPNPWAQTGAYTVATSVALERMTSTKHWPSDVYFGALWGWFVTEQMFNLKENRNFKMQPLLTDDGQGVLLGTMYSFSFDPF